MPDESNYGSLLVDAREVDSFAVDLAPGATRGMLTTQKGFKDVQSEIVANQNEWGERAGVLDADVEFLQEAQRRLEIIDRHLPSARKALEILVETRAFIEDQRQRRVFMVAQSVDARAKSLKSDELLAKYANTREYRSSAGNKAARTRKRNLEAGQDEQPPEQDEQAPQAEAPQADIGADKTPDNK